MWEPVVLQADESMETFAQQYARWKDQFVDHSPYDMRHAAETAWYGELAEYLVWEWVQKQGVERCWHREQWQANHDFDICAKRVEVKCKRTKGVPHPGFQYMVNRHSTKVPCDCYLLTYYHYPARQLWLVGFAAKDDYIRRSTLVKHGECLPGTGHRVQGDSVYLCQDVTWVASPAQWLEERRQEMASGD